MANTLITGASGFVGTHLIREMTRRDLPYVAASRQQRPGFRLIPSDLATKGWDKALLDVDTVVHLGARVHMMRESASDLRSLYMRENVDATLSLATEAARRGVRRFVFVSSIKVNGERTEEGRPFSIIDVPQPVGDYAVSKWEAEQRLHELGHATGLQTTIVRPPLVYGRGVKGNFRTLMTWASLGLPSIFASIKNKRSLVHVGNLCDLILTLIEHRNASWNTFLVSDGIDLSTHELVTELTRAARRKPKTLPVPQKVLKHAGNLLKKSAVIERLTESLQVDTSHTEETLAWHPLVPWPQGLADLYDKDAACETVIPPPINGVQK